MDPLNTVRRTVPAPVRHRLEGSSVHGAYDAIRSSSLYAAAQRQSTDVRRVSFDTALGDVPLLVPETAGLIAEKVDHPGGYEPGLVETLAETLSADDVVFDVGAGFGYNAALARTAGVPQSRLHLFEANAFKADVCRQNHPRANLSKCVIGDGDVGNLAVDAYADRRTNPSVVLVDIEGAEFDALKGMYRTLTESRPTLLVELHPELLEERGVELDRVYDYLWTFGYELSVANHRVPDAEWSDDPENPDVSREAYTPTFTLRAE